MLTADIELRPSTLRSFTTQHRESVVYSGEQSERAHCGGIYRGERSGGVSQALERIRQAIAVIHPRWEKLWGGRRRLWHLHRPYELMEAAPCYRPPEWATQHKKADFLQAHAVGLINKRRNDEAEHNATNGQAKNKPMQLVSKSNSVAINVPFRAIFAIATPRPVRTRLKKNAAST